MTSEPSYSSKGAIFSPCKKYRYILWREWKTLDPETKSVMFIMLNPSTADENVLDPTVRRCLGYAMDWGYNRLVITNIFSLRSTDPKELYKCDNPIGDENDKYIDQMIKETDLAIAAWGAHSKYKNRGDQVITNIKNLKPLYYLQLTKDLIPCHPLYLKGNLKPKVL